MSRKWITTGLVFAIGIGAAVSASAQVKPEVVVKWRQSAMSLQGKYFYAYLRPVAQGKMPYDANLVARNVAYLDMLAKMPWDGFVASTKDVKSATLPAAYSEPAKFKEAEDKLLAETAKLVAVTKSGDEAAIKAQILAVDKACGGCHESFRERQ